MNLLSLPQELLIKILLKLPGVRYLLRIRCVSRFCGSLVSNPVLAKLHFEESSAPIHRVIILKSAFPQILSIDLHKSLLDDSACAHIKPTFQIPTPILPGDLFFQNISSCRGLVLLWNEHSYSYLDLDNPGPYFYVWNPSTGVHRKIPRPRSSCCLLFSPQLYGFWYDQSTEDYLLVLAYSVSPGQGETQFEVFSLKANSWQTMEGTYYMRSGSKTIVGSVLNGAMHWLVGRRDDAPPNKRNYILAFDLVHRSFFEIDLPDDLVFDISYYICDLWIHGGLLSLWILGEESTDIWVMEEYKVHSSWTKSTVVPSKDFGGEFIPICSYGGNIFGWDGDQGLVKCNETGEVLERRSYDDEKNYKTRWEELGNRSSPNPDEGNIMMGAGMYVESLLSLPDVNAN